jgi:transposase-like protein
MSHRNAPLSVEGRRRLVARCEHRPIVHVAAEMGISRQCASKWVHRYRQFGELGLVDRPSTPHSQPTATTAATVATVARIEGCAARTSGRRTGSRSNSTPRAPEISRRTMTRHWHHLGLNRRRFIDPTGANNRPPRKIIA